MGQRITQLDAAGPLTGAEWFPLVQEGKTKKVQATSFTPLLETSCKCTLVSRYNVVGTDADTLEKYFHSWQMPGSTIPNDGSWLEILAWGSLGNNGNNKRLTFYFGSSSVTTGDSAPRLNWEMHAKILRTSATTQSMIVYFKGSTNTTTWAAVGHPSYTELVNPSENMLTSIPISLSAQNGTAAANDVTVEGFIIELHQIDVNS